MLNDLRSSCSLNNVEFGYNIIKSHQEMPPTRFFCVLCFHIVLTLSNICMPVGIIKMLLNCFSRIISRAVAECKQTMYLSSRRTAWSRLHLASFLFLPRFGPFPLALFLHFNTLPQNIFFFSLLLFSTPHM